MNVQPPLTLADYTAPDLIIPQLANRTTTAVARELTVALQHHEHVPSCPLLLSASLAALNQELLTSRMLDLGAVFPQVRVEAMSCPRFALGRSSEPLPWLTRPFEPISLIFLVLEPENAKEEFSRLVGTLRNLGKDPVRLDDLRRAATVAEVLAVLVQVPLLAMNEAQRFAPVSTSHSSRPARATGGARRWRH